MNSNDKKSIYAALAAPFATEAIERSDGRATGKGYSTTGIKHQYIVNRLNEVLGVGGFRMERTISVTESATAKGRPSYEATCEVKVQLGEWVEGTFVPWAEAIADGGHSSINLADARKGATTNGFKKCVALFGVGRSAYEGTIDDDNATSEETPLAAPSLPTQQQRPIPQHSPARSRLTAKQLAAIYALSQRNGQNQAALRQYVVAEYGTQPDYLTREQASHLIESLGMPRTNGNGGYERQPGGEG
jgi:hypothetical protein